MKTKQITRFPVLEFQKVFNMKNLILEIFQQLLINRLKSLI